MAAPRRILLGPVVESTTTTTVDRFGSSAPPKTVAVDPETTGGIDESAPQDAPPQNVERAAQYHAQRPEPAYDQFKPEFVDSEGREYAVARSGDFLEQQDVSNGLYTDPPTDRRRELGRLLLWLRMPINLRHSVDPPDPDGERLQLYHAETQVLCEVRTESVFVMPRMSTGHVFVSNMVSTGKVSNPAPYEKWLQERGRVPGAVWF